MTTATNFPDDLHELLNLGPCVIYTCEPYGNYAATFVTENVKAQTGHEAEAFTSTSDFWAQLLHPDDAPRVFADMARLFDKGHHAHDYRIRHKDGGYRWVRDSLRLFRDADGKPDKILGSMVDITEPKRVEQELRKKEARLAAILAIAPQAIISTDSARRIVLFNLGAEDIFGYPADEAIGQPLEILLPARFRAAHDKHIGQFIRSDESSRAMDRRPEIVGLRKDGTEFPAEALVSQFDSNGDRTLTVVLRDITERKERESRYRRLASIVESTNDAILAESLDGEIVNWNAAAERMFGYSAKEVIGKPATFLEPPDRHGEIADFMASIRRGENIPSYETARIAKDGSLVDVSVTASAIKDEEGNDTGISVSYRDIRELIRTRKELAQAQKMEVIGHLTGGVAHDFNNLLTAILGNLEFLADYVGTDSEARPFLDIALKAGLRGADLTQRLLAFSRRQTLRPEPTDLNKLVPRTTELLNRTLTENIEIETVLASGLWHAEVDPSQLEHALLNLAINARDAMPAGGRLTIETANAFLDRDYAAQHAEVEPGQYAMLAVSDSGTGMTPQVMERAFEPFFTTKGVSKGTGLGLSMVYGFVKQSGGHIKIYSEVDHGTTIKLYFPKAKGAGRSARRTDAPHRARTMGDETILVVEDDADVRAFLTSALALFGYTIIEAEDGPAAISLMDEGRDIDLLFTDVVLPKGMNGREVADAYLERYPDGKILFSSGYTENAIVHNGRLDEGVELLAKPYTRETLGRVVRQVLDAVGK